MVTSIHLQKIPQQANGNRNGLDGQIKKKSYMNTSIKVAQVKRFILAQRSMEVEKSIMNLLAVLGLYGLNSME